CIFKSFENNVAFNFAQFDQRIGQTGNGWFLKKRVEAVSVHRAVEKAKQFQNSEGAVALRAFGFKCVFVSRHDTEGMAALFLSVGFFELNKISMADIAAVCIPNVGAEEIQGECVTFYVFDKSFQFLRRAADA